MATRKGLKRTSKGSGSANEPAFPLETWLENSKSMIGQPRYIVVGATHGRGKDERFTKAQMKELVRRFLKLQ